MSNTLPPGWASYKTEDGKEYYYNATTGITQWDKPVLQPPTNKAPPLPNTPVQKTTTTNTTTTTAQTNNITQTPTATMDDAERGDLLSAIRNGARLKKAPRPVEKPITITENITVNKPPLNPSNSTPNFSTNSPNLTQQLNTALIGGNTGGNKGGGFAEIMKKKS